MPPSRNVLVHECFGIDVDILWQTVTHDVPALLQRLHAIVAAGDD